MSEANHIPLSKLENRMRPGIYSQKGFLGPVESLEAVMMHDRKILENLGISHAEIAAALERILLIVEEQRNRSFQRRQRGEKMQEYTERIAEARKRDAEIPDLYYSKSIPNASLENLPSLDQGYQIESKFHVFITRYRGWQSCPWGCEHERWSSFDFLLLNRETGEYIVGPGMIVHLLREHCFFEGLESPYRVDPIEIIQILDLVPQI